MKAAQPGFAWFILLMPVVAVALVPAPACAGDAVFITEFMAENDGTVEDEDGDTPDWIEICNAGTNVVNLGGWYLTDSAGNLSKWRFPATNLPVNACIVVYASGKDRRTAGRPLHSSFRLDNDTGFVALVKPDGTTIQSSFTAYPQQVAGVSYGLPVSITPAVLISNGSAARFAVPVNGALGMAWTAPDFNDTSWATVTNGVGFEADAPPATGGVLLADSAAEFSGNQGGNNWFYGYWDKKADTNGTYEPGDFTPFPRGTGNTLAPTNYWDGTKWDWPAGNPPWTELTVSGGHPAGESGNPALPIYWTIRRYVSETNGPLRLTGLFACSGTSGTCGDGTVGHIFVDGVQVWQLTAFNLSAGYSVVVNANPGSTIDFVIDPGPAANDFCDTTTFTASIRTAGDATVVADTMADWSENGVQGQRGWTYGYFNKGTGGTYAANKFTPFPGGAGPQSTANFWNGESWQWFDGDPPFDTIGRMLMRPSTNSTGGVSGQEHWVIRRWTSEVNGTLQIDWHLAKKDLTGGGVIGTLFQNGTQRDAVTLAGADFVGTMRSLTIPGVQAGDFIDIAVAPGADVIGDLCFLNATIHGSGTLSNQFVSDVGGLMTNINASAWLRLPFTMSDAATVNGLTLRMKYDDGFVAYLNGTRIAAANAPEADAWNAAATGVRPDPEAGQFQEFNVDSAKDFLVNGPNVLAIHGLNASAVDSDFLMGAELVATRVAIDTLGRRYFASPTPGSFNGIGTTNLGPLITAVNHAPPEPLDAEDLVVTAKVSPSFNAVTNVSLYYRVLYGAEIAVPMLDDGLHGDGLAGDGIYGASIPNAAYTGGQMVRYYLVARDSANSQTRQPPLGDTNNSSLYFGTVVQDPSLTSPLPVLHWFTQNTINSTTFGRASIYWQGELYDNIKMNVHGQSSQNFRNHSFNLDFNPDHKFKWDAASARVDDINLLSSYADKAHLRVMLSYGIHADAGPRSPSHFAVPVRVQSNGVFHSILHIVENGDANYLRRLGRDPNGALYKMYTVPTLPANAEKKTRRFEDKSDFQTLVDSINSATNRTYLYDNVDVSEAINFFAAMIVTGNLDCCHKNFYLYRDSDGDGEWEMMPWDVDLSFGRNWQSAETYWDDRVYPNNGLFVGGTFPLGPLLFTANSTTRAMYMRRVRTLQDQMLQTNGTPAPQLVFEQQIDRWMNLMSGDAALDLAKWGTWGGGNGGVGGSGPNGNALDTGLRIDSPASPYYRTLPQSVQELKTNYLVNRRKWVFNQKMNLPLEFPDTQPTNAMVLIGALDFNPSSGNQNEEYIQLLNTNSYAVDISGWKLSGAVEHTFQGGVVIPRAGSSNMVFVVPDKKAFRNRATAPRGGFGLYVEGPYKGHLSARGEALVLSDPAGRVVTSNAYVGNPTPPQQYLRITEIMYHPPVPPPGPYEAEDFEYIELKNIGPTALDLTGVHFGSGVEFSFTGSAVTNLGAGQYVLVVRNSAAFTARYGAGLNIAGQYTGILANEGEEVSLYDAVGEEILDFEFDNDWYPISDGPGASLVIVDPAADWKTWRLKESWRPSAFDFGSPSLTDPAPVSVLPVFVNEVLSHSVPPATDVVELANPNAVSVDISGWFLSDDFATPRKFRIPPGTIIPSGGFMVFNELQFNPSPGVPPSFALSSLGDEIYLFSGNGTNLTGWLDGQAFGATEGGVSLGRYTNSQGTVQFVAQSSTTFSNQNALPGVGPVIMTEIMYHPPDLPIVGDNTRDEFIELANIGGMPVPLFDPSNPTNTWRLRSAVDFDFPTNVTLPSGGYALVVGFSSTNASAVTAFRSRFNVPAQVPIFGPWSGKLDNSADSLRLEKPDAPLGGVVPHVLVERIDYSGASPWPLAADGLGGSLQRLAPAAFGNDPTNWIGAAPTGGVPFVPGGPPVITLPPSSVSVLQGSTAMFGVTVSGAAPFAYQWQFNSNNIVGANGSLLVLPNLAYAQAGAYRVIVLGAGGSVESPNATLTVLAPPALITQPTNTDIRVRPDPGSDVIPNTNAVLFVAASSANPPLTYQWRMNGTNLPPSVHYSNVTAASLIISNVTMTDFGDYSCAVADGNGTIFTTNATLFPLVRPTILVPSVNQTQLVVAGGSLPVSAVLSNGWPPPFLYQWRIGSATITNSISALKTNFYSYPPGAVGTNVATAVLYRLVVTNRASPVLSVNAAFYVTTLLDSDHDGIPDSAETDFGLDPNSAADALLDRDGDGMSNLAEYLAGTDATNAASYLRIDQSITPGVASVNFAAVSNRTYTIQVSDSIPATPWFRLADFVALRTNRVEVVIDPAWTTNRFYRVVTPRLP